MDHSTFTTLESITHIWTTLNLPRSALHSLSLPHKDTIGLPSSYKVGHLAQASIALSALAAALIHTSRNAANNNITTLPRVSVPLKHACLEFLSERWLRIDSAQPTHPRYPIGGLHATANGGHVRIHDSFPHHRAAALALIGCDERSTAEEIKARLLQFDAVELETRAMQEGNRAIVAALRGCKLWNTTAQAQAVMDFPVRLRRVADGPTGWKERLVGGQIQKCLSGIRVLEFSRVIAAPVAGRTLAAHGADVLWVTSPKLPDLPALDRDTGRGKRTIQLDLDIEEDVRKLEDLLGDVDIVIQGYRPGALAGKGLDVEELVKKATAKGRSIVYGSLSAYGSDGPWSEYRGFDSIVQTQSGLNVSEAEHFGQGDASKVLPCQALDHASGYFLAFSVMAALYKQATEGGSYAVEVSLAATMKYLKSLGQYQGRAGFNTKGYNMPEDVPKGLFETRDSVFGKLTALRHSASIEGVDVGWDIMPKPLGSDKARWL